MKTLKNNSFVAFDERSTATNADSENDESKCAIDESKKAVKSGETNVVTYNSMINAACKNGDLKYAMDVFDKAVESGIANIVTYNTIMDGAGKSNNLKYAMCVFDSAVRSGIVCVECIKDIDKAFKDSNLKDAIDLFKKALESKNEGMKKEGFPDCDDATHHAKEESNTDSPATTSNNVALQEVVNAFNSVTIGK